MKVSFFISLSTLVVISLMIFTNSVMGKTSLKIVYFVSLCCVTYRIFVPWPGIKPEPIGVKAYSSNPWTAEKFKNLHILIASNGEHILNCLLTLYFFFVSGNKWQLESFGNYVASCYPSICPFLLIKYENRINYIKTKIRIFSF